MLHFDGIVMHRDGRRLFGPLDLELGPGGAVIDGPSGSGKTTLLRIAAGLALADEGLVRLDGEGFGRGGLAGLRRRVHRVDQEPLLPGDSLREALNLGRALRGDPPAEDGRLRAELESLGLERLSLDKLPGTLSGGERMRLAVIRGLLLETDWLLLDEPTAALDPASADRLAERLSGDRPRPALLCVSHDRRWIEAMPGRRLRLENGELADA